jgi:diphthamide biosynthesis protein 4
LLHIINNNINNNMDYYQVLGVPATASAAEIKQRYQALVLTLHPDKRVAQSDADGDELFGQTQQAWSVLRDANLRKQYDHWLLEHKRVSQATVSDEIDLDDMHFDEQLATYSCSCRYASGVATIRYYAQR